MTTPGLDLPEIPPTLGSVVEEGRGSLPFALIHGEGLVACAAWALGDAGVTAVDHGTPWSAIVEAEGTLLTVNESGKLQVWDEEAKEWRSANDQRGGPGIPGR